MIYVFRNGYPIRGMNPQEVGQRLESIRQANNGRLLPDAVVEDAKAESAPTHPAFEWDDMKAAAAYRVDQARGLISAVTVRVESAPDASPVRAFVHLIQDGDTKATYINTAEAMSRPDYRAAVLEQALKEVRDWQARYEAYAEFALIFEAIDKASSSQEFTSCGP